MMCELSELKELQQWARQWKFNQPSSVRLHGLLLSLIEERISLKDGINDAADAWKGSPTVELSAPQHQQQQLI